MKGLSKHVGSLVAGAFGAAGVLLLYWMAIQSALLRKLIWSQEAAGWAQAVFTGVSIYASGRMAVRLALRGELIREREKLFALQSLINSILMLFTEAARQADRYDADRQKPEFDDDQFTRLADAIGNLPLLEITPDLPVGELLSLREALIDGRISMRQFKSSADAGIGSNFSAYFVSGIRIAEGCDRALQLAIGRTAGVHRVSGDKL